MKIAKRLILTTAALTAVTVGTLVSATVGQAATPQPPLRLGVTVPDALKVPDGNKLTGVFSAAGVQTYTCTNSAWTLLEPAATLWAKNDPSKRSVALHSRGPVWVSTVDGSAVNGSAIANSPKTGTIPELLLKATATRGTGVFADVSYVQRLNTTGGVAPTTACTGTSTDQVSVQYTATYAFYKPAE